MVLPGLRVGGFGFIRADQPAAVFGSPRVTGILLREAEIFGDQMKNKRLHILAIFYIAVFAILFQLLYPETSASAAITVIAILGYAVAIVTDMIIRKSAGNKGKGSDE